MKKYLKTFLSVLLAAVPMTGCEEPAPLLNPEFSVDGTSLEVPADGGRMEITYTLENPVQDARVIAFSDDEWITMCDEREEGKIFFDVDPNEDEELREGAVTVSYSALDEEYIVKILQRGAEGSATDTSDVDTGAVKLPFRISVLEAMPTSVSYEVLPDDKEMGYITMAVEKAAFDKFGSDEDYFQSELSYYILMAESIYGVPLGEYLKGVLHYGDTHDNYFDLLSPDTGYYAYAYGLSLDGERLTDIVKEEFSTAPKPNVDAKFEFSYSIVPGTRADVSVFPDSQDYWYYFSVLRTEGLEENYDMVELAQGYLDYVVEYYMMSEGGTVEDAMRLVCFNGIGLNSFELLPDKEYSLFAVAVDLTTGLVVSEATEELFDSGSTGPSDNVISLETVYEGFTDATVSISTTNSDPYVFCIDLAENWEGMSEEEMLEKLTKDDMSYFSRNGDFTAEITGREPGTEYRAFAFGYSSGIATTGLTSLVFKTHELGESGIKIEIVHDKYFDGAELREMYPEKFGDLPSSYTAVMPVSVSLSGAATDGAEYRYAFYEGDYSSATNVYDMAATLLGEGCPDPSAEFYFTDDSYDKPFTIMAVVCDKDGNFGELFREVFTISADGKSPVEEYQD